MGQGPGLGPGLHRHRAGASAAGKALDGTTLEGRGLVARERAARQGRVLGFQRPRHSRYREGYRRNRDRLFGLAEAGRTCAVSGASRPISERGRANGDGAGRWLSDAGLSRRRPSRGHAGRRLFQQAARRPRPGFRCQCGNDFWLLLPFRSTECAGWDNRGHADLTPRIEIPPGGRPGGDFHAMAIPRPFPRLLPHPHQRRSAIDEPTGCGRRRVGPMLPQKTTGERIMPLIEVHLIENVFDSAQKKQIIEKLTDAMVSVEGENMRGVTWVKISEVVSGEWAIGGQPLTTEAVKALAAGKKAA